MANNTIFIGSKMPVFDADRPIFALTSACTASIIEGRTGKRLRFASSDVISRTHVSVASLSAFKAIWSISIVRARATEVLS